MRSFLFVPGDSPRKFAKASATGADALILDLEDSVAPEGKAEARARVLEMLAAPRRQAVFVRVNALDTGLAPLDLAAVMPGRPDGIVLPKCEGPEQVRQLSGALDLAEALQDPVGSSIGATPVLAIVTETAESVRALAASSYREAGPRLWGMMWGGEDLAASLGAGANRSGGRYHDPFLLARNLCLVAAAAAGVEAIDTIAADIGDLTAVEAEAREARRDGFTGKAVIHPNHVDAVNAAFTASDEELAWARTVCEAFANKPGAGVVKLNGKMVDKPHLRAAERVLARSPSGR